MKLKILILTIMITVNIFSQEYFVTAKSGLNVRNEPNLKGEKIGKLLYNEKVKVIEETSNHFTIINKKEEVKGLWGKIKFHNKTGYVFNGFLKSEKLDKEFINFLGDEKWNEIFKENNKWVNYLSCVVANHGFQIRDNFLDEILPMDMAYWKISSLNKENVTDFVLKLDRYSIIDKKITGIKKSLVFEIIDKKEKIIILKNNNGKEIARYVPKSKLVNYEIIEEKCKEE